MKILVLTDTDSGNAINIHEEGVLFVEAEGTGSKIQYKSNEEAVKKQYVVNEDAPTILGQAARFISVTDRATATTILLNADRVVKLEDDEDAKAEVFYDVNGAGMRAFELDETAAAVIALVNAL